MDETAWEHISEPTTRVLKKIFEGNGMAEQKNLTGALFKNDRKQSDTHPDYTGNCTIEGKEFWINAWLKEGPKGKYYSFSFKPKDAKPQPKQHERFEHERRDIESEIPF